MWKRKGISNLLPNGDVVWDLNGEWDALYEWGAGKFPDIVRIPQQSDSFVGVKTIGSPYVPKGAVSTKGELDKNGVKKAVVMLCIPATQRDQNATCRGLLSSHLRGQGMQSTCDCKGQISEDGNKIILDGGDTITVTLTGK